MSLIPQQLAEVIDRAMDFTVVPGFSAIGYRVRRRLFDWQAPDLTGKSVMITGSNSGLGKAAALESARCGAIVHMVCRNPQKGQAARDEIVDLTGADVRLHICDLSDLASVREFTSDFLASAAPLDVLINNAGVMPEERQHTDDGFELTFATNVLGLFLLTEELSIRIGESEDGRVITMSSGGMYSSGFNLNDPQLEDEEYKPTTFYAHTKRAEVMLTDEWNERAGENGPSYFSMHPGWAVTPGMSAALPGFNQVLGPVLRDTAEGADTAVWLCAAGPEEASGGSFFQDRKVRSKHRIPRTRDSAEDRRRLYELCAMLCVTHPD
ncbi:MAG: SDR family NAD(P)-dependent oxidoreductase [Solirubrobacterales bacterium]